MLEFHLEKGFLCLKIKSQFSRPCAVPQRRTGTRCSLKAWFWRCEWAGRGWSGGAGLQGGGAGCSGPLSPPPLTPAVFLLQPENTPGLSSVDWGGSLIVASWTVI